jgi:hypothetical protein
MSTVREIKIGRIANTSIATKIGIKVWGNALKMFSMSVIIISGSFAQNQRKLTPPTLPLSKGRSKEGLINVIQVNSILRP